MQTEENRKSGQRRAIRRWWKRIRASDGQSLIELCLILPVLLGLAWGALGFGRLAYAQIEVNHAAAAGAAYGATNQITASDISGMKTAALNDGADITGWKVTGLTAVAGESCTCTDGTKITCADAQTDCTGTARILEFVQVNTQATIDPLFYFPGLPKSYTLTGQAKMRVP